MPVGLLRQLHEITGGACLERLSKPFERSLVPLRPTFESTKTSDGTCSPWWDITGPAGVEKGPEFPSAVWAGCFERLVAQAQFFSDGASPPDPRRVQPCSPGGLEMAWMGGWFRPKF